MLSIFLYYLLYKTSIGLELRSVGENPKASDSLGVNVFRMRYVAAIVGAMLMGLAGAYLPMVYTGTFTEGMVQGRRCHHPHHDIGFQMDQGPGLPWAEL